MMPSLTGFRSNVGYPKEFSWADNIYVNDINSLVTSASLRLYADDTTTYESDQCSASLELSINTGVKELDRWFCDNYLTVNAGKTQAMQLWEKRTIIMI